VFVRITELVERSGATARQIDYWAKGGVFDAAKSPGSGGNREFTADDLAVACLARTVTCLVFAAAGTGGASVSTIRRLGDHWRQHHPTHLVFDVDGHIHRDAIRRSPASIVINVHAVLGAAGIDQAEVSR
jgi:DNA-binding transcriptional MerR regulator